MRRRTVIIGLLALLLSSLFVFYFLPTPTYVMDDMRRVSMSSGGRGPSLSVLTDAFGKPAKTVVRRDGLVEYLWYAKDGTMKAMYDKDGFYCGGGTNPYGGWLDWFKWAKWRLGW